MAEINQDRNPFRACTVSLVLALAGCAGSPGGNSTALSNNPATATYQLTAEEKELDCKKLTGRMQVRILQVRDYASQEKSSAMSRTVQGATQGMMGGGTAFGSDPDAQYQRDRAQLQAYNNRLAELNCKTFNLAEELTPKSITDTPSPAKPGAAGKTN